MEDADGRIIIEDDNPTEAQLEEAFNLAKAEFGDYVADYESDEFREEFNNQLNAILTAEAIKGLIDKGIAVEEALDGGEVGLRLTPYGEALGKFATSQ
jgi:hypothetical protein